MKQTLLLILLFFFARIQAQNLLRNPSFESKKSNAPSDVPSSTSQFKYVADWEEDMNDNHLDDDGNTIYYHSPDFYSTSYNVPPFVTDRYYNGTFISQLSVVSLTTDC